MLLATSKNGGGSGDGLVLRDPGDESGPRCRICLSYEEGDLGPFVSPCNCTGSVRFVHAECVDTWRRMHSKNHRAERCTMCLAPYRTIASHRFGRVIYLVMVRIFAVLSLGPLSVAACELLPNIPRRSSSFDLLGLDVSPWSKEAFGFDAQTADVVTSIIQEGGCIAALKRAFAKRDYFALITIFTCVVVRFGSFGLLSRFVFSTKLVQMPRQLLVPGLPSVLTHYVFSIFALHVARSPQTPRQVPLFALTSLYGLSFWEDVVENALRSFVMSVAPFLEVPKSG